MCVEGTSSAFNQVVSNSFLVFSSCFYEASKSSRIQFRSSQVFSDYVPMNFQIPRICGRFLKPYGYILPQFLLVSLQLVYCLLHLPFTTSGSQQIKTVLCNFVVFFDKCPLVKSFHTMQALSQVMSRQPCKQGIPGDHQTSQMMAIL